MSKLFQVTNTKTKEVLYESHNITEVFKEYTKLNQNNKALDIIRNYDYRDRKDIQSKKEIQMSNSDKKQKKPHPHDDELAYEKEGILDAEGNTVSYYDEETGQIVENSKNKIQQKKPVKSAEITINTDDDDAVNVNGDQTMEGDVEMEEELVDDTQSRIDFSDAVLAEMENAEMLDEDRHIIIGEQLYLLEEGYLIAYQQEVGETILNEAGDLAIDLFTEVGGDVTAAVEYINGIAEGGAYPEEEFEEAAVEEGAEEGAEGEVVDEGETEEVVEEA